MKLSVATDMGAKNNGVFIVKSEGNKVLDKKASCIVIDGNKINFSKKSRRENRHKDRNYKRRKLAKRLLRELVDFNSFTNSQQEEILGLLNNRGYTFLSTEVEFEELQTETVEFNKIYCQNLSKLSTKDEYEEFFTNNFDDEKELLKYLEDNIQSITKLSVDLQNFINKKKISEDLESLRDKSFSKFKAFSYIKFLLLKNGYRDIGKNEKEIMETLKKDDFSLEKIDFEKEFEYVNSLDFNKEAKTNKKIITDDFKIFKDFLSGVKKEIETGSKPRKKYLKDIKDEIEKLDFTQDKTVFYNLIGNISNLQLRVLRKFFNYNSQHKSKYEILQKYFKAHHYKKESEKVTRKELFEYLGKYSDLKEFLVNTPPYVTIPPYEDMNNRDTYKCNSMLINPELITEDLKKAIDIILNNDFFSSLLIANEGVFEKEEEFRVRPEKGDVYKKPDFTYSKYLQRILDATEKITGRELNPRNVFKHQKTFDRGTVVCVDHFKKIFGNEIYATLKEFAEKYYQEESLITGGIYKESTSIFTKCNTNTAYKDNVKHLLLKPVYSYNFTETEGEKFLEKIKETKGLQTALARISEEAKKYQNSFYSTVLSCFDNEKCIADKEIQTIIKSLNPVLSKIKEILKDLGIKSSYLKDVETITAENISRVLNIFKQTYEILFKDLKGFSKTCKHCSKENGIRSDEKLVIAKRLLSDVAKPIDGMLDMMLDRLAYEITEQISIEDLEGCDTLEILLEQNRFEFEESLNAIKRSSNSQIKRFDPKKYKDPLNSKICPYTGVSFDKGDYDHILPQSKGVYNSKSNMIYVSTKGNLSKNATLYTLEMLASEHLKDIFRTEDLKEVKEKIKRGLDSIDKKSFTNFDNLKLAQQIALRYALFMRDTEEFNKAFDLVKLDKIKTITNGTQKRLARFIYKKLTEKFPETIKNIEVSSKTIGSQLVSSARSILSETKEELKKQEIQNSHSHAIDAMTVFYLANGKLKGLKHRQKENISQFEPLFEFDEIYLPESAINNLSKKKTFINSPKKELGSYPLFDGTIYSEHYKHITKESLKDKELQVLIKRELLFENIKNKKHFIEDLSQIQENKIYKIDVVKTSNLLHNLFMVKKSKELKDLKFLDALQYFTSRKEIRAIFIDEKGEKLLPFDKIKNIPPFSKNLYKAVYTKLQNQEGLFTTKEDGKSFLNSAILEDLLINMFASQQKEENKQQRKRGKKKHKFGLPILGSPKFRIKRGKTWQVLGNKDIATKNYIINGSIKPIAFFSDNTIPVKVSDLIDCLLIDKNTKSVYEVAIDTKEVSEHLPNLTYFVSEANRCTVLATFARKKFNEIDFGKISQYDGAKDEEFKKLITLYIDNKEHIVNSYIGSIRDGEKAKAVLIELNSKVVTLQYKAAITKAKKELILQNELNDETPNS